MICIGRSIFYFSITVRFLLLSVCVVKSICLAIYVNQLFIFSAAPRGAIFFTILAFFQFPTPLPCHWQYDMYWAWHILFMLFLLFGILRILLRILDILRDGFELCTLRVYLCNNLFNSPCKKGCLGIFR